MKSTADVVVVGGGIVGCATAAELARNGAKVMLIERAQIASAASGRNHGLIWYPQSDVLDPLYRTSHRMYQELSETSQLDIALDSRPRGILVLVQKEEDWQPAEGEARAASSGGAKIERLDDRSLKKSEPHLAPSHLGAWRIDDGYRLDPALVSLALAIEARQAGAEVVTHTDVKQILIKDGTVTGVATDSGVVQAPTVVNAAGPWAAKLTPALGGDLPISGARGWLIHVHAEEVARHVLIEAGWHLVPGGPSVSEITLRRHASGEIPASDVGLVIQQNPGRQVLLGGSRLTSTTEDPEGPEVTQEIAKRAVETVPQLAEAPIVGIWSGVRPVSPDGIPLIGWLPGVEGFFVAGGHGGQGVILAGGTGRLAAQMILGSDVFVDPKPFSPERF
jgi:glycine/D-amino acid oxidase-like deaminating enzyme